MGQVLSGGGGFGFEPLILLLFSDTCTDFIINNMSFDHPTAFSLHGICCLLAC